MADTNQTGVTVVQSGEGDYVALPGFGAVFKLSGKTNGGEVSIVEHPFEVGFRSDDSEVVLGPGGYITKPRGQMHAMWNAGSEPGRIIEIITPGGFENYFRELGELLVEHANDPAGKVLHELPEFGELAEKYGLTYGTPVWMDDIVPRYGLNPPSH